MIVLMQTGGESLEAYAVRHASASLEALLSRAPRIAHRLNGDVLTDIPVAEVVVNDGLVIRPGELVPVDSLITSGTSAVDESALTGEPTPVTKRPGDEVLSGSICTDGALQVRAIRSSQDSQYEHIVQLVQTAQREKAPVARLADRYAVVFTPVTLLMCGLAYVITREPSAMVAVLVVATPCPLILATPVAIISGVNRGTTRDYRQKRIGDRDCGPRQGGHIRQDRNATSGMPVVEQVQPLDGLDSASVLKLAGGLEQVSSHPMARALVSAARTAGGLLPLPDDVTEAAGQGVTGHVGGRYVTVGPAAFAIQAGLITENQVDAARFSLSADGDATAVVGVDGSAVALITFKDNLRPVPDLLRRLRDLGISETVMLTGDDQYTAERIGREAGISRFMRICCRPEGGSHLCIGARARTRFDGGRRHKRCSCPGDREYRHRSWRSGSGGIGGGRRYRDNHRRHQRVADAVEVGRHTLRIAHESIWVGLGVSSAMMVVAAFGGIPPTIGALLQEVLDVAVILNALRAR